MSALILVRPSGFTRSEFPSCAESTRRIRRVAADAAQGVERRQPELPVARCLAGTGACQSRHEEIHHSNPEGKTINLMEGVTIPAVWALVIRGKGRAGEEQEET